MSRMITRSMTATGRGARHHLLAIAAEIRSIILSILFDGIIKIHVNAPKDAHFTQYYRVPFKLFWICRTLRAEAMPHFAMAPESSLVVWPDTSFDCLTRSVPPGLRGLLDHLRRITFSDAPTTDILDNLGELPCLHTVIWKPNMNMCNELRFPDSVDQMGRTDALDDFLMTLLELDHEKVFYSQALREMRVEKGSLKGLIQQRYIGLLSKARLVLLLEIYLDLIHPKEECEGFLRLVSYFSGSARCLELTCLTQDVELDILSWKILRMRGMAFYGRDCDATDAPMETGKDIRWDAEWHDE